MDVDSVKLTGRKRNGQIIGSFAICYLLSAIHYLLLPFAFLPPALSAGVLLPLSLATLP